MIRSFCTLAAVALVLQAAPRRDALSSRVQAYLDEWRAGASFPGAAVGIVLKDGTAFAVTACRIARRAHP